MRKALPVVILALLIAVPAVAQTSPAETVPFDHWAYDAVQQVCEAGVIIGYPDGTFKGDRAMTRYEFAMAISRLLDIIPKEGAVGPAGEAGAAGAAGPQGEKGEKGDTGECTCDEKMVADLIAKLCEEFKEELADVKEDLEYLTNDVYDLGDRVAWLEEQMGGPEITGWLDYRIGLVGEDLDLDHEFDNLTAAVGIAGDITDDLYGNLTLKTRDSWAWNDMYDSNTVWLDEAYVRFPTGNFATWTVGRQKPVYALGLVVDFDRQSGQGVRGEMPSLFGTGLDVEFFAGNADEAGDGYGFLPTPDADCGPYVPPADYALDNDGYLSARAVYGSGGSWGIGANALISGVSRTNTMVYDGPDAGSACPWLINDEVAVSVDFWAEIWDREIYFEAARLEQHSDRPVAPHVSQPCAYMGTVELWETDNFKLTGFYSSADAEYDIYYSSLNPYFETLDWRAPSNLIPWEAWLRRPLVMTNVKAIGGTLNFDVAGLPFEVCYYSLDALAPTYWNNSPLSALAYDTLYAVKVTKELTNGVDCVLTYAHQTAADVPSGYTAPNDQNLLQAGIMVGF